MKAIVNKVKDIGSAIVVEVARQIIVNTIQDHITGAVTKFMDRNKVWVQIDHDNTLYSALLFFLSERVSHEKVQRFKAAILHKYNTHHFEKKQNLLIAPGEDEIKIMYKGQEFIFDRTEPLNKHSMAGGANATQILKGNHDDRPGFKVTTHKNNRDLLVELLKEAYEDYTAEVRTGASVYYTRWGSDFHRAETSTLRPWESVVLPEKKRRSLESHVEDFFDSKKWYTDRGIPYRKGFLLHGPPGTGKTSIVKGLAKKYNLDIYIINFSGQSFDENTLTDLFNDIPEGVIVLFEDIDGLFHTRAEKSTAEAEDNPISFRGFINLLDGVMSPEGVLVFMTTNFKDRLDDALIRPGRIDVRMEIGYIDEEITKQFFRYFYKDIDSLAESKVDRFWEIVKETENLSISVLQAYLTEYRGNPEKAVTPGNFKTFYKNYLEMKQ